LPAPSTCLLLLLLLCSGRIRAAAQQIVTTGGKATAAASTASYASTNTPVGSTPTAPVDGDAWYDSTQNAEAFRQSSNTTLFRGGAVSACYNFTAVTFSSGGTGPATLQTCTGLTPTVLNTLNKLLKIHAEGYLTIPSMGTTGIPTFAVTLGGTQLCAGSGQTVAVNNGNAHWEMTCYAGVTTTGASGAFNVQGNVAYRTTAGASAASSLYGIVNIRRA
jgi:hypothetical protein